MSNLASLRWKEPYFWINLSSRVNLKLQQVIALTLTLSIGKIVAESKLLVRTGMELNQNFKHDLSTNLKKIDKHVSYSEPETYQQIQFCTWLQTKFTIVKD